MIISKKNIILFLLLSGILLALSPIKKTWAVPNLPNAGPGVDLNKIKVDLEAGYKMECVPSDQKVARCEDDPPSECMTTPAPVEPVTFSSGSCTHTANCDIVVCGYGNSKKQGFISGCAATTNSPNYFKGGGTRTFGNFKINQAPEDQFLMGDFIAQGQKSAKLIGAKDHTVYAFFAVSPLEGEGGGAIVPGDEVVIGDGGALQQATFSFVTEATETTAPTTQKKCVGVFWDPYGRVFDSVSFEPLGEKEAQVAVLDKDGVYVELPSNNVFIDSMGKYNIFLKEDGYYKLSVSALASHEFTTVTLDPKYKDLYHKTFIPGDPAFYEKASDPQRIDIAVKPKSIPYQRQIDYSYINQKVIYDAGVQYALLEFRVTHPLTVVKTNVVDEKMTCAETDTNRTNKDGFCTMAVPLSKYPQEGLKIQLLKDKKYYLYGIEINEEEFVIDQTKISTNKMGSIIETVSPILQSVEGYAYDSKGMIIPNAVVKVVYKETNQTILTATADESGFFSIPRKYLPPLEYYLEFRNPDTSVVTTQSTAQFVRQNKNYIESNKINLMTATQEGKPGKMSEKEIKQRMSSNSINSRNQNSEPQTNISQVKPASPQFMILAIVCTIILLIVIAGIALFHFSKKNN